MPPTCRFRTDGQQTCAPEASQAVSSIPRQAQPMSRSYLLCLVSAVGLLASLEACTTFETLQPGPTPETIAAHLRRYPHASLYLTDTTGAHSWLTGPALRGDTLFGFLSRQDRPDSAVSVPLARLRAVTSSRPDGAKTIGAIFATLMTVTIAFFTIPREAND